jgi:hypothetical protein
MSAHAQQHGSWGWLAIVALWAIAVAAGMGMLWRYKNTPGEGASAPVLWPTGTGFVRARDRMTLVLFAHPRCTCTRATLTELAWLIDHNRAAVSVQVAFMQPPGVDEDWVQSDTYRRVGEMHGVARVIDHGGAEARRFGAATSGQALLYDASGRLLFSGGLTGSRGHPGDNLGRARVAALLRNERPDRPGSSVFGCELEVPLEVPRAL